MGIVEKLVLTSVPLIGTTVGDEHDNYVKFQMISNNYGVVDEAPP